MFEFGLATQKIDDPVRTGRESTLADQQRSSRSSRGCSARPPRPRPRRVPRAAATPRRFIGVNVIYNKYWPMFTDYVGANINPFCSQVLAGIPLAEPVTMKEKVILKFKKKKAS